MIELLASPIPAAFIVMVSTALAIATSRKVKAVEDQVELIAVKQISLALILTEKGAISIDDLRSLIHHPPAPNDESVLAQVLKDLT